MLSIHLFNLAGYSLLFQYFISKADLQLVKQLDEKRYNNNDLLEVKVPLNMPYINDTKDFERVDGQLEYKGVHYNYVKRKVTGDTLYMLCLPNVSKTKLYAAKNNYSKEVNDIPTNKKNTEALKKAGFATEYRCTLNEFSIVQFVIKATAYRVANATNLSDNLIPIPEQPPKAFC